MDTEKGQPYSGIVHVTTKCRQANVASSDVRGLERAKRGWPQKRKTLNALTQSIAHFLISTQLELVNLNCIFFTTDSQVGLKSLDQFTFRTIF